MPEGEHSAVPSKRGAVIVTPDGRFGVIQSNSVSEVSWEEAETWWRVYSDFKVDTETMVESIARHRMNFLHRHFPGHVLRLQSQLRTKWQSAEHEFQDPYAAGSDGA